MATTKKSAEKKAEETPKTGNSGPGTGTEAPPESSHRPPAGTVTDPEGAPLDPPADTPTQTEPEQGHPDSSTDRVYAASGGTSIAGEEFSRLVDEKGKALSPDALFDDSDTSKTFVVSKTRVFEEFYYPGTTEVAKRLLFAEGKRVPRAQAERIKAAASDTGE